MRPRTARDLADGRVPGALRNEARSQDGRAVRRLGRLEIEHSQLEDEERAACLEEAVSNKHQSREVDKWFVDKGFGFGKVQIGEVVFIYASVVQGAEVLVVGTDARMQVLGDHAQVERGTEAERRGAQSVEGGEGQRAGEPSGDTDGGTGSPVGEPSPRGVQPTSWVARRASR